MKLTKYLFGLAMMAFTVYSILHGQSEVGGVTLALIGGMHDSNNELYRIGITKKMQLIAEKKSHWINYMGFAGGKKDYFARVPTFSQPGMKPTATGMPLEVLQDFRHGGGEMEVPIFSGLTQLGVSGGVRAKGKGEKAKLAVLKVGINQKRGIYLVQDTAMSKQIWTEQQIKRQLYDNSSEYLGDWFGAYLAYQPYLSLFEGSSENLTNSEGGIAAVKRSHMNFYTEGAGRTTFSNVKATYEQAVANALTALGASNKFTMNSLRNMAYHASHDHNILPFKIGGENVYLVTISDAQSLQLQDDTTYNARIVSATERSIKSNPAITGKIVGIINQCLVVVDATVPSAYVTADADVSATRLAYDNTRATTGDANGVCYGTGYTNGDPDFMENRVDPGDRQLATLLGSSAVMIGVADDIYYETEEEDFKDKKEVAAIWRGGMQRSDIFDFKGVYGTTGDFRYKNNSSLVYATKTPNAPTYA